MRPLILVFVKVLLKLRLVSVLAALVIAGCTSQSTPPNVTVSQEPIKYSGKTIIFHERSHGTQIEYFSSKGQAFLWYPGSKVLVTGSWKVHGKSVCFRYGANTYNPVTKRSGGRWQCVPSAVHRFSAKSTCAGNPFNLSSGAVPFQLSKEAYKSPKIVNTCNGRV